MNVPVMAITPATLPMICKYHRDDKPTYVKWLRIYLTIDTANRYNDGLLTEIDMHGMFDLAQNPNDDWVLERAPELLNLDDN
jgi:hypothetical protein